MLRINFSLLKKLIVKLMIRSFFVSHLINYILPKKNYRIFFSSYPDFSDNPFALYKYIIENYNDEFECIWEISDKKNNKFKTDGKTIFVKKNSLNYFYYLFTSKFVFTSHGINGRSVKKQINVPLYHGIPYKAWGYLEHKYDNNIKLRKIWSQKKELVYKYIATSKVTKLGYSAGLNIDAKKIEITGFPRHDLLLQNSKISFQDLLGDKLIGKKIILYMPTFRYWLRESGLTKETVFNVLKNLKELEENKMFLEFLEKNNYVFIYKLHPFEEELLNKEIKNPYFIQLRSENLQCFGITIYNILNKVDILVSDYSSIFIEFLLLNRPIFCLCPDFNEFNEGRELIYSPIEFWFPGPICLSNDEFINEIVYFHKKSKKYEEKRRIVRDIFFEFKDGKNCRRVFDTIIKPYLNSQKK